MDGSRIRRELTGSLRLLWTEELWLYSGAVTVLAAFFLWVGATGAALTYGADFAGVRLSVVEWSSVTTVVLAVVTVLWVLAPAALVTYLVRDRLTNVSGNLQRYYRVEYPSLLVLPFLVLYGAGVVAAVALGTVPIALAAVLTAVALLVLVRTIAYSYRVFSFSVPLFPSLFLFASLVLVAVTTLTGAAVLAGRRAFVEAAAAGVGDLLGTGAVEGLLLGSTAVGPVTASTLLLVTGALPVALSVAYVVVQSLAGLVARVREPEVPRSKLRTGQRYPAFARPASGRSSDTSPAADATAGPGPAGPTDSGATSSAGAAEAPASTAGAAAADAPSADGSGPDDSPAPEDDVSHTRVFTAPDDGDFDDGVPGVDDSPGGAGEKTTVEEGGYRCPTCTEKFESDTNYAYCPTCGTELEAE